MARLIDKVLIGFEEVFDLEVLECPNFFVNGINVHNSSKNPNF